jgi:hypothetical protein
MQYWELIAVASAVAGLFMALDRLVHRRWAREHQTEGMVGHAFEAPGLSQLLQRVRANFLLEAHRRHRHHWRSEQRRGVREHARARCRKLRTDDGWSIETRK